MKTYIPRRFRYSNTLLLALLMLEFEDLEEAIDANISDGLPPFFKQLMLAHYEVVGTLFLEALCRAHQQLIRRIIIFFSDLANVVHLLVCLVGFFLRTIIFPRSHTTCVRERIIAALSVHLRTWSEGS